MTKLAIKIVPIDQVKPYERNPRLNDQAVDAVAASLRDFGFRKPIVVDGDSIIICGHTCWKAAKQLGLERVPIHIAKDLTPEQAKAYRIADNKTSEIAAWDNELLALELSDLQEADVDLTEFGFSTEELTDLLRDPIPDGQCDPDDVPEPPDAARTKLGDIWILGDHRLMCGDSSKPEDLDRLLDGETIHLVHTDPPYNVAVEPRSNNAIAAGEGTHHQKFDKARKGDTKPGQKLRPKDRPLLNDFVSDDEFDRLLNAWFGNMARVLAPGRSFYIWGGYVNCLNYPPALKAAELYFSQAIIWIKEHPVLTRKDFMGNHEWCFYGWREGAGHKFFGPHNVQDTWRLSRADRGDVQLGNGVRLTAEDGSRIDVMPPDKDRKIRDVQVGDATLLYSTMEAVDVWSVKKVHSSAMVHLTEKPVELARRAIEYSSKPGENVLDLFGGSGSTLIGAQQTGRKAFLMELDPLYCDVIIDRFEKFTGQKAKLASKTGNTSGQETEA
jgi:DNA modification methylase